MKVNSTRLQQFNPITLVLTFETQQELDAFGTLFNFSPVGEAFSKLSGTANAHAKIYEEVSKLDGELVDLISKLKTEIKAHPAFSW